MSSFIIWKQTRYLYFYL